MEIEIAHYLKYANLQIAAEAFIAGKTADPATSREDVTGEQLESVLGPQRGERHLDHPGQRTKRGADSMNDPKPFGEPNDASRTAAIREVCHA